MSIPTRALIEAKLAAWRGRRVLVLGDLIADRYVLATPSRLSREAPVIIAAWEGEKWIPGGAANALQNLHALGVDARPFGLIGDDAGGRALKAHWAEQGIDDGGVIVVPKRFTVTKTRFLVGDSDRTKQQVLRIDREPEEPPHASLREELARLLVRAAKEADAVLCSDYGYGAIDPAAIADAGGLREGLIVTVDARYGLEGLPRVTMSTPNLGEVESLVSRRIRSQTELEAVGPPLRDRLGCTALLVTQGNQGMTLFESEREPFHLPIFGSGEVTDVTGAGDTVIATATAALVGGATPREAAALANLAAGITVMKIGAATASPQELFEAAERLS